MERIGRYQLVSALPRGGNADVYVAVREGQTEKVVVKVLRDGPGTERWRRFVQEIRVVRGLGEFPGVLPIFEDGVHEDPKKGNRAWYAMPFAARADEALADARLDEIVTAVASYAETLSRLHVLGHYHRDLKPANLYRRESDWLLGDFGLVDVPDADAITQPNRRFGPANFLPYELVVNPDTANGGPVDVYELAKTLWVLAAPGLQFAPLGPQRADGDAYTLERLTDGNPLAQDLDRLIEACTRTDPLLRPSMAQVSADLQAWIAMSNRREAGDDGDALRDAAAALRHAFADDLTQGRVNEQRVARGRRGWTSVGYGMERLYYELAELVPGAITRSNHVKDHRNSSPSIMEIPHLGGVR
jgi:serine/threonine protein kinase